MLFIGCQPAIINYISHQPSDCNRCLQQQYMLCGCCTALTCTRATSSGDASARSAGTPSSSCLRLMMRSQHLRHPTDKAIEAVQAIGSMHDNVFEGVCCCNADLCPALNSSWPTMLLLLLLVRHLSQLSHHSASSRMTTFDLPAPQAGDRALCNISMKCNWARRCFLADARGQLLLHTWFHKQGSTRS
jgi:hypothetical protein